MRWWPLIALALLVGVAVGAPYGVGMLTESMVRSTVQDLEDRRGDWRLANLEYERGYLNAVARYELRWRTGSGEERALPLVTRFNHGLTDVRAMTRLTDETLESLSSLMKEGEEPRLRVEVGVGGAADIRLRIPQLEWGPDTPVSALAGSGGEVAPVDLHGEWHRGGEHRFRTEWPGLSVDIGDARIELASLSLDHQLSPLGKRLWQGSSRLDVDSLTVDPVLDDPIVAESLDVRFDTGVNEGYLDAGIRGVIGELRNAGRSFGRQALVLNAERLHTESLDDTVDSFMALQSAEVQGDRSGDEMMAIYERLSGSLQALSARGGRLDLKELLLALPDGTVEGEGFITYPRLPQGERNRPVSLLRHAQAEAVLNVDRGMVWALPRTARRLLDRLEREGVVTPREDRYHLDLRLDAMKLRVNDHRFEVPPLL